MSKNKSFFKQAKEGSMSMGEIFSDMAKRHSAEDTARVLTAGTVLTTPEEKHMLADWQKPFLFARFFVGWLGLLLLAVLMATVVQFSGGYYLLLVGIPFLVPVTLLLLVWEMNIPRNISLYDVITATALGGVLSILAAALANFYSADYMAVWAGLVEEPAKLVVIYIILRKKNYKYALNGALVGMAVGTGFAVMETLIYVISAIGSGAQMALISSAGAGMTLLEVLDGFDYVWVTGIFHSLFVAIARAVTAVSGHGIFAALYGSALVKAKGEEEISLTHLVNPGFLAFFAVSILLHALHNYGLDLGMPALLDGLLPSEYIIIAAIAIGLLLNTLHIGVNQVVAIGLAQNDGRLTYAVDLGAEERSVARNAAWNAPLPPMQPAAPAIHRDVKLLCVEGPMKDQKYRFQEGQSVTVGRSARENGIVVSQCKYVGGVHCRLEVSNGRLFVTDLTSKNGTYLDDQRLSPNQPMPALNGSLIRLGNEECIFKVLID
jgi:RsiW-degrading membrane proteinase PrsW (M82 family)